MKRKRSHIPLIELLASALADKLPQVSRDVLRAGKVPAAQIVRMFTADHIHLHSLGGPDLWWNLDMRRRDSGLKAKDARDTGIAAKSKRLVRAEEEHKRLMKGAQWTLVQQRRFAQAANNGRAAIVLNTVAKMPTPKRKIASRGFAKGKRTLRSHNSFGRTQ
jgi:hypothetical protein